LPQAALTDRRQRRCSSRSHLTRPEHRPFQGFSLALLCLTARPAVPARAHVAPPGGLAPVLYVVAGAAWKRPDGPYAELVGYLADGRPNVRLCLAGHRLSADLAAELNRADDLLSGRSVPVGRPSLAETGAWRVIAERAEQIRAEHPGLSWRVIAEVLGVDERTLRTYRRMLERERADRPAYAGPILIPGGCD
jgi:hypothetical protein